MESSGEVCDGTERKPPPVVESEFRERKSSTQSPRASNSQSSSNARGNVISSSSSGDDAPGGSEQSTDSSSSPPSSPVTKDERSTGSGDEAVKLPSKKSGQPKRDRSKLRKGKWTVEEEEYTSRIIHYFSTGMLTLPEGATLRSYLADKLNCDPMRVTKKYAGASCLGRRAYHLRDRSQPTVAEIQLAKAELDILEQRFRLRVEEGRSGLPLPRSELLMNFPSTASSSQPNPLASAAALQTWLLGLAGAPAPAAAVQQPSLGIGSALQSLCSSNWMLPAAPAPPPPAPVNPLAAFQAPSAPSGVEAAVANLLFARVAASLANSLPSQLSSASSQQSAASNGSPVASVFQPPPPAPVAASPSNYAEQLRQNFEEHLRRTNLSSTVSTSTKPAVSETGSQGDPSGTEKLSKVVDKVNSKGPGPPQPKLDSKKSKTSKSGSKKRTVEDQAAGTILIGFLSSLRDSYEEALSGRGDEQDETTSSNGAATESRSNGRKHPANVTDSSSSQAQPESSVEDSDWNSDKKTDPSSSEDSDKDDKDGGSRYSKGPPRKRLKKRKAMTEQKASD